MNGGVCFCGRRRRGRRRGDTFFAGPLFQDRRMGRITWVVKG